MNVSDLNVESDPKIFKNRFARCRHLLHFLAVRILGSEDEAEHAVRSCRAAASRNPPNFESEGAFRSWLARILIDEACALLRRKQFSSNGPTKSLHTNPEGSSGCRLYGDNDAYTLGISDWFRRTNVFRNKRTIQRFLLTMTWRSRSLYMFVKSVWKFEVDA